MRPTPLNTLLVDVFLMTNRPLTINQSNIDWIHSSLLGIAPLWISAASCSIVHALLELIDCALVLKRVISKQIVKWAEGGKLLVSANFIGLLE
jgi:hypothetical protein